MNTERVRFALGHDERSGGEHEHEGSGGNVVGQRRGACAYGTGGAQANAAGARRYVGMSDIRSRRVGVGTVSEVPETVGDGAGGRIGERDGQWGESAGRVPGKIGGGDESTCAGEGVSGVAAVAQEEGRVGEITGIGGSEADQNICRCEGCQTEGSAILDA